jgi:hypothetical protein
MVNYLLLYNIFAIILYLSAILKRLQVILNMISIDHFLFAYIFVALTTV